MKIKYELLHKEKNCKARYGKLHTNYGSYETPIFMPVGTLATVKTLDYNDLKKINSAVILSNEPRSALESRRVSLGAPWVDSRESSLLRRLERGREVGL